MDEEAAIKSIKFSDDANTATALLFVISWMPLQLVADNKTLLKINSLIKKLFCVFFLDMNKNTTRKFLLQTIHK